MMNIGDKVYLIVDANTYKTVTCPDCAGKKEHKIILGNGEKYMSPCGNCKKGYYGSIGTIDYFETIPMIVCGHIHGVKADGRGGLIYDVGYKISGVNYSKYSVKEETLSRTEEGLSAAFDEYKKKCEIANKKAREKQTTKRDGTPFGVSYHRRLMNDALKECNKWAERFGLIAVLVEDKQDDK